MKNLIAAAAFLIAVSAASHALGAPGEALDDPALEARARVIAKSLRCVVCQNQSIDDSDADLARDMRTLVRERILRGDTDEQVIGRITDSYGDFVLLRPPVKPATYALWFGPPVLLAAAFIGAAVFMRRRAAEGAAPAPLSATERERLNTVLHDRESRDS
ncbi:MAG: cytochrome c-type biogenesis protein [Rhodospirillales bacterium]